jgi:hypothetical protein
MANASARRSFHGPVTTLRSPRTREARKPDVVAPARPSRPLELVPAPPSDSSVGRAVLAAARSEEPTTSERARILAGVLAALQLLTGAGR